MELPSTAKQWLFCLWLLNKLIRISVHMKRSMQINLILNEIVFSDEFA